MIDIEDPAALVHYLRDGGWIGSCEQPVLRRLPGGVSNRTVLVARPDGQAWVIKQALAKLRVAVDWFAPPGRVGREAAGLRILHELAPPGTITPLIFEDPGQCLLAMQAVPQPHENWKAMLLSGRLAAGHVEQFGYLLGVVHAAARGRNDLAGAFADQSAFESLRLEPYYAYTAGKVQAAAAFLYALIDETRAHHETLVHGDYSPKNILVYHGRLILVDHEVIHFGDPSFDLGFALSHLLSKAHYVRACRQRFAAAAGWFWDTYQQAAGAPASDPAFQARAVRQALGCLLARVEGRSPLEYLSAAQRTHQRQAALVLLADPPPTVAALATAFVRCLP
jgi:5-methylthioribose kinase